jgi:4-alpha-glucanotransferase
VGWYKKTDEKVRDYVRRYLNVSGDNINWDLIRLTIMSSAVYAVIPMQDVLGLDSDARMNTPGVREGNWQFRYSANQIKEEYAEQLSYICKLFNR